MDGLAVTVVVSKRGLIGTDTHKGGNLRRAVALQLSRLRGKAPGRLAELRSAWSYPDTRVRVALVLPMLWQSHIELYCAMLYRLGVTAPKRALGELCSVTPETVSRWLNHDPAAPSFYARYQLTILMPDIVFPSDWSK